MKYLISAIQFITILPAGKNVEYHPVGMVPYFPLVGLIIGLLLAVFDMLIINFWPAQVVAVLDVIFLLVVTGAFHIDGLGDSADGIFSHRPKERVLEIMKDSRIGVMGLVAIVCGLAVKWGGIASLPGSGLERGLILFIIPSYARGSMIFGVKFLEYGRKEGTGRDLFDAPLEIKAFRWLTLPVLISVFLGLKGLLLNLCFVLVIYFIINFYKKKMGCITGDMLGAMTEITESMLFLLVAANIVTG
jgi:adenosylcobinamide-GDP ribazoletransferase